MLTGLVSNIITSYWAPTYIKALVTNDVLSLIFLESLGCYAIQIVSLSRMLTLLLLNTACPILAISVDPDQLASEEANWSESTLFAIKCVNLYQQSGSSNLIGWNLEMGVAS